MSFGRIYSDEPIQEKWLRISRWYRRALALYAAPEPDDDDCVDYTLACLGECFSMSDWLRSTQEVEAAEEWGKCDEYRFCRDLTNGSKHFRLLHPTYSGGHILHREYLGDGRHALYVQFQARDGSGSPMRLELGQLCKDSVERLGALLLSRGLITELA